MVDEQVNGWTSRTTTGQLDGLKDGQMDASYHKCTDVSDLTAMNSILEKVIQQQIAKSRILFKSFLDVTEESTRVHHRPINIHEKQTRMCTHMYIQSLA